jgi:hypothetical protein
VKAERGLAPRAITSDGFEIYPFSVFNENGLEDWSQLTILLAGDDALWSHEGQEGPGARRSLPYLRRKTWRTL